MTDVTVNNKRILEIINVFNEILGKYDHVGFTTGTYCFNKNSSRMCHVYVRAAGTIGSSYWKQELVTDSEGNVVKVISEIRFEETLSDSTARSDQRKAYDQIVQSFFGEVSKIDRSKFLDERRK